MSLSPVSNLSQKVARMPNYKDASVFSLRTNDKNFDAIHRPGQPTPYSGIYKCISCGFEVASTKNHPLPPTEICTSHANDWKCNHGVVRWKLVAAAIHLSANA